MARISEYRKLTSKIEKISEKIKTFLKSNNLKKRNTIIKKVNTEQTTTPNP